MITSNIPGALPHPVARDQEIGTPHHRLPGYSNDVNNVLALEPHVESKPESVEGKPDLLSEMNCVYFDDMPVQRLLVGKFMGRVGFKESSVFDTGKEFTSKCEFIEANRGPNKKVLSVEEIKQRFEWRKMKTADIIITDINDTDSVTDPSGGLRRGKMALEAGKIVIFVSGHGDNSEIIDREFSHQHRGQYIFLSKPIDFKILKEKIGELVASRK